MYYEQLTLTKLHIWRTWEQCLVTKHSGIGVKIKVYWLSYEEFNRYKKKLKEYKILNKMYMHQELFSYLKKFIPWKIY